VLANPAAAVAKLTALSTMTPQHTHATLDMQRLDGLLRRALVFNHIYDAMIVTTPDGKIRDWNSGAERMFGWSRTEALGQTPAMLHRAEDAPTLWPSIHTVVTRQGRWSGRTAFVRKDGGQGWCGTVALPLLDQAGNVWGTLLALSEPEGDAAAALDLPKERVTLQWPEEPLITDDRFLLRALIDAVPDAMYCKDRKGRYLLQNDALRVLFAIDEDEALGQTAFDFPGMQTHAALYHADDMTVVETGQPVVNREEPFERANGERGWLLTSKYPLRDEHNEIIGLAGISHDITQVKRAAKELQEAQLRLLDHVENSPLGVIEWEPDFRIARWVGQSEAIFGWKSDEVLGRHFSEFPFVHPDDEALVQAAVSRLVDGRDRRNTSTNRNLTKTGQTVHTVWQSSVLHDSSGRIVSILTLVQDVTDRVVAEEARRKAAAERRAFERKLQETQKLESLGILAGGIAHDFNNLLGAVLGNASLASMDLPPESPIQPYLSQIETAALRAAELCKQMLAYSGKGHFVVEQLDLNALIQETTRLLQVSITKRAVLQFHLAPDLPAILGDATQLRQVVMNLVINASEALGETSGYIIVTTGLTRADRDDLAGTFLAPDLPEGDYLYLEIADTGCGMTPEVRGRIFDPFYTTKFTGRGLGLAAVLGIVRGHQGALNVSSERNRGTTFRILLPSVTGPADPPVAAPVATPRWRGSGSALVVDDEETVCATNARMLEMLGFSTRLADNGQTALEIFRASPGSFALVVLDLTMPHMDGEEAFRQMIAIRPETRVLLTSGFNEQQAIERFAGKGLAGFLQKPFTVSMLREKLQEIFSPA